MRSTYKFEYKNRHPFITPTHYIDAYNPEYVDGQIAVAIISGF